MPPALGYDDISVLVNTSGGPMSTSASRMSGLRAISFFPVDGGRGLFPNHNAAFYADDGSLATSVCVHAYVAVDHLSVRLGVTA